MRDLIKALKSIEESKLPVNRKADLNSSDVFRREVTGAAVLLDRIDEMACESLVFNSGRLEGEPDLYNVELIKDAGFDVLIHGSANEGTLEGEIVTSKGRIRFG